MNDEKKKKMTQWFVDESSSSCFLPRGNFEVKNKDVSLVGFQRGIVGRRGFRGINRT